MDVQIKELIEKIKSEGVKPAEEEAARIIQEAEKKADEIRAQAHKDATQMIAKAKSESTRFEQSGKQALKQAGRNLILSLKSQITDLFDALLVDSVQQNLTEEVLQEAILTMLKSWDEKNLSDLEVLLSPQDLEKIEDVLRKKLSAELKKGVEIKPLPEISAGFRITMKDGSVYYNFSDQGLAEILAEYLNPKLAVILNQAISGNDSSETS